MDRCINFNTRPVAAKAQFFAQKETGNESESTCSCFAARMSHNPCSPSGTYTASISMYSPPLRFHSPMVRSMLTSHN